MGDASWSKKSQLTDSIFTASHKYLFLDASKTDGSFKILGDPNFQVGWGSTEISGTGGTFTSGVVLEVPITSQTVNKVIVIGNDKLQQWPTKYDIALYNGTTLQKTITNVQQNSLEKITEVSPGVLADKIRYTFYSNNKERTSVKLIQAAPDYRREATDNQLITLAEQAVMLVASKSTDVATFSLAEAVSVNLNLAFTDIVNMSFNEVTAMTSKFSAVDSTSMTFTDVDNISPKLTATDSINTSIVDTEVVAPKLTATDSINTSLTDVLGGNVTSSGSDEVNLPFTDVDNISPKLTGNDTINTSLTESDVVAPKITGTETINTSLTDVDRVSQNLQGFDDITLSTSESDRLGGISSDSETTGLSLTERDKLESIVSDAFWSRKDQLTDSVFNATHKYLFLDYNQVDGSFKILGDPNFQVGWGSIDISGIDGIFNNSVRLEIPIEPQTVDKIFVIGNDKLQQWPTHYDIQLYKDGLLVHTVKDVRQNTLEKIVEITPIVEADTVRYTFYSNNQAGTCLKVIQAAPDYRKTGVDDGLITLAEQEVFLVVSKSTDVATFSLAEAVSVSGDISIVNVNDLSFTELTTWLVDFSDTDNISLTLTDGDNISPKLKADDTVNVSLVDADRETANLSNTDNINLSLTDREAIKARVKETDILELTSSSEEYFIMPKTDDINLEIKDKNNMVSIHTVLKAATRTVHCKVRIKYTLDDIGDEATVTANDEVVYNSDLKNLINGYRESNHKYAFANEFTLEEEKPEQFHPLGFKAPDAPVGFRSKSDLNGVLAKPLEIVVSNINTDIYTLMLVGDLWLNNYPVDFKVDVYQGNVVKYTQSITGNTDVEWIHPIEIVGATKIVYTISKISRPGLTPKIQEVIGAVIAEYNSDEIVDVRILEESIPSTTQVALGAMSANQLDLTLLNTGRQFSATNANSRLKGLLKSNREIRVWFGANIEEKLEWYQMGIFYSGPWKTSYSNITASILATDRLSLLQQTTHTLPTKKNITVFQAFFDILTNAGLTGSEFVISEEFRNQTIPWCAIPLCSHVEALGYIAEAHMCFIYCDRVGRIMIDRRQQVYSPQVTYERGDIFDYGTIIDEREVVNDVRVNYKPYLETPSEGILNDITIYQIQPGEVREFFIPALQNSLLSNYSVEYGVKDVDCEILVEIKCSWGLYIKARNKRTKGDPVQIGEIKGNGPKLSKDDSEVTEEQKDNPQSIRDIGRYAWSYAHDLIQSYYQAESLCNDVLNYHGENRPIMELDCRGDFAIDLGHDVMAQCYNDFDKFVPYKQIRAQHNWDGAYRAQVSLEYQV